MLLHLAYGGVPGLLGILSTWSVLSKAAVEFYISEGCFFTGCFFLNSGLHARIPKLVLSVCSKVTR